LAGGTSAARFAHRSWTHSSVADKARGAIKDTAGHLSVDIGVESERKIDKGDLHHAIGKM
jgi:hypothetical protein